jgi:glycosyltransferase involved in cell wall biosynthesis
MMPKISIIVPVYNVEKYIHQCVDSLIHQTLTDIEIILVDDRSPDNCPQICEEYTQRDNRIKVIHKENGGLGYARNSGLNVAAGEYVAFVDSDDYVDLETYQRLYNSISECNADVIYFAYERFNSSGYLYGHSDDETVVSYDTITSIRNFMLDMVGNPPQAKKDRNIQVSSCCALYKRELIEKYQIKFYSERELISEDLIFNLDYLLHASLVLVTPCSFYKYRVNIDSLTSYIRKDRIEKNYTFYRYLLNWLNDNEFGTEGHLRATRLFIGYCRSCIRQYLMSSLSYKQKMAWLTGELKKSIWKEIAMVYPYRKLPFPYALYFYLMYKRYRRLVFLYSML